MAQYNFNPQDYDLRNKLGGYQPSPQFFPQEQVAVNPVRDSYGNIQGQNTPAYNVATADDSLAVQKAKAAAQGKQFANENPNWAQYAQLLGQQRQPNMWDAIGQIATSLINRNQAKPVSQSSIINEMAKGGGDNGGLLFQKTPFFSM